MFKLFYLSIYKRVIQCCNKLYRGTNHYRPLTPRTVVNKLKFVKSVQQTQCRSGRCVITALSYWSPVSIWRAERDATIH